MISAVTEFYIIHADLPTAGPGPERARSGFVGTDDLTGPFGEALRFDSLEAAEAHLAGLDAPGGRFLIQLCSREQPGGDPDSALASLITQIMEIPPPYRRTAYNWLRGKDVQTLLRRQGEEVYRRHIAALADHDLDITRPSAVVLMRPKRRRRAINTGGDRQGPRQFVALPSQRPSAAPVPGEPSEEE